MSDRPSDTERNEESFLQREVQEYLDLMLSRRAPVHADGDAPRAEKTPRPPTSRPEAPSAAAGGQRDSRSTSPAAPQPRESVEQRQQRPFAEPTSTVSFKMPGPPPQERRRARQPPATRTEPEVELTPPRVPEPPTDKLTGDAQAPPVEPAPPEQAGEQKEHPTTVWLENGRPVWAQERFECLLFSVGGLKLAVPLVELGSIYPIQEELTPIFGQAEWFMGLLPAKDFSIKTVDTARLVMPERYSEAMSANYAYVVTINGVDWGLAVDDVSSAIPLDPDQVRWRGERSKRPWLAGTVVDHMCALLDVSQLAAIFTRSNRPAARH